MAWTAPMTAVANTVFTAAQFNTHVRDNLNETAPAKATTAGSLFVASGVNQIAERIPGLDVINTSQTTTSTSYTDLATVGPSVTVTTGTSAIVFLASFLQNNTASQHSNAAVQVSGATTIAAADTDAIRMNAAAIGDFNRVGAFTIPTLTPGSNTFTMKYRVAGGTGTFANRALFVIPL